MLIDRVLGVSEVWAAWAVAVTWQLAALAVVAWLCERVLRLRQPGARYGLWWFLLAAPLVLAPTRMALERREAVVRVTPPAVVEQAVARVRVPVVMPVANGTLEVAATRAFVPDSPWWSRVRPADVLAIAWVMGCLMLVARLVVGHARARRLVNQSRAVTDGAALGALKELCAEAGVKQEVGLRVSSSVGAPVLYGVRRPTILLPEDWVETLAADDLRALLAHEVAHVKRRDFLANLVQRIVEIPLFFHPGAWLATRQVTLAREELADGWALARGVEASSYARSLATMAERTQARLGAALVGVAEGKSTLLRRVEAIMRGGSRKRVSRPLVVALIGAALVSAGAFAAVEVSGGPGAVAADKSTVDLRTLDGEMKNLGLAVRMYLQDSKGVFPPTDDIREIQSILGPYLASEEVFTRELRWVMPAGISVSEIENTGATPFAVADHGDHEVIAYVDGHTYEREKTGDRQDKQVVDFTIVDDTGAPIAGAKIRRLEGDRSDVLRTDGAGKCKGIVVERTGGSCFFIQSPDGGTRRIVTVRFKEGRQEKEVTLAAASATGNTVTFSGRVVDERGRPVAGASLWVYGFGDYQEVFLSRAIGTTDENGRFSLEIPRLSVGNQGWGGGWIEPWTCQIIAHKRGQAMGWVRTPGNGIVDGGDIRLGKPTSVSGAVRDVNGVFLPEALVRAETVEKAGAKIQFESMADAPPWLETRTDEKGRFEFADLPADGIVKLDITTCGAGESYRADEMAPDLGEIKLTEKRGELVVKLVRRPLIEGILLGPDREPASGVKVMLKGPIKGQSHSIFGDSTFADETGHYRFALSVAGTWTLVVADKRFSGVLAKDLAVDLGQHITIPTTVLQASAIIRGRVLDALTGAPVANVHVTCRSTEPWAPAGPLTTESGATTTPDGSFEVGGPPGRDILSYSGPPKGYTWNHTVKKGTRDGRRHVEVSEDPAKPRRRILTVKPGEALTGLDLFVTHEAEVTGVVLGPDGSPWQPRSFERGGYVHGDLDREVVTSTTYPPLGSRVGQDGTFSGRYYYPGVPVVLIVVDEVDGLGGAVRVTPELAEPTRVTIHLSPTATVVGRVIMPDGTPAAGVPVGMAEAIAATTDEDGHFAMRRGVVGVPLSVGAHVRESPEGRPWDGRLTYLGKSESFEIAPGTKTFDVGDIVLEPYEPKGRS